MSQNHKVNKEEIVLIINQEMIDRDIRIIPIKLRDRIMIIFREAMEISFLKVKAISIIKQVRTIKSRHNQM